MQKGDPIFFVYRALKLRHSAILLITWLSLAVGGRGRSARCWASLISPGRFSRDSTRSPRIASPRRLAVFHSRGYTMAAASTSARVCAWHGPRSSGISRPFFTKNRWRRQRAASNPIERESTITRRCMLLGWNGAHGRVRTRVKCAIWRSKEIVYWDICILVQIRDNWSTTNLDRWYSIILQKCYRELYL